ncbi:hypothetical protein BEM40_011550 [Escherichia sp. MOD1-EC5451]|nr:hypothetical protein [Escherichia coli]PGF73592.1 hypothetical protein BMR22_18790 [Escherichia marmotae]PSS40430.1 hypothetical protein BEM40_011550 [Escherichia sp. MOD1-EC5451]MIA82103.1 hypothetical protein [Escherichia coli]MIA82518.1 hypothetical protein [Escherichia coli]
MDVFYANYEVALILYTNNLAIKDETGLLNLTDESVEKRRKAQDEKYLIRVLIRNNTIDNKL